MPTSQSYDPSNIFAKILRGEIPCHKVYEDADAIAFMDVMPQSSGHTLIVPKAVSRNVLDADPAVLAKIMPLVQKIAIAAKAAFNADGISVMQFNEPAGGQTVFHLHYHVCRASTACRSNRTPAKWKTTRCWPPMPTRCERRWTEVRRRSPAHGCSNFFVNGLPLNVCVQHGQRGVMCSTPSAGSTMASLPSSSI